MHPVGYYCAKSILILSSHLRLGLPSGFFPQLYKPKPWIRLSFPPYAPHFLHVPLLMILSPEKYWVRSIDH